MSWYLVSLGMRSLICFVPDLKEEWAGSVVDRSQCKVLHRSTCRTLGVLSGGTLANAFGLAVSLVGLEPSAGIGGSGFL